MCSNQQMKSKASNAHNSTHQPPQINMINSIIISGTLYLSFGFYQLKHSCYCVYCCC